MAVAFGAACAHCLGAEVPLRVCADTASPNVQMDERVAQAIAEVTHSTLQIVEFSGIGRGGDGFPTSRFAKMAHSDCELIMGFPVDRSAPHLPEDVQATVAYAVTGFVLIQRRSDRPARQSLDEFPEGSEVGIAQLDTYAGLLYSEHRNLRMHVYPDDAEMLHDLSAHRIVAALGWQPAIEHYTSQHARQSSFRQTLLNERHMQWNLVALYDPHSEVAAGAFERGLQQLRSSGSLARLVAPFQLADADPGATSAHSSLMHTQPAFWVQTSGPHYADGARLLRINDTHQTHQKRGSPPALYTEDQAKRGFIAYEQNCGMCHGPLLTGQIDGYPGPALKGADFADPSYNFHVNEIFNFVAKLMPPGKPGSLPMDQDVIIMAYLLQQNGYPAGSHELTYDEASHSKVPVRYYGPPK